MRAGTGGPVKRPGAGRQHPAQGGSRRSVGIPAEPLREEELYPPNFGFYEVQSSGSALNLLPGIDVLAGAPVDRVDGRRLEPSVE